MKHIARRLLCLLLAVALCAGMICVTAAASTEELPPEGSLARKVVDSCEYTLDLGSWSTVASEGGAGHLQGICTDDEGNYLYASFTNMLVKVDMHTGKIAGTVTGLAAGSISNGAHIGDICYYDGKIYGSLEYKAERRWYICVFDGAKITKMDMPYTTPGVMYGLYVPQVGDDFKNELTAGEHENNPNSMGHRYGTGGIDGITFGTLPGRGYDTNGDGTVDHSTGDKRYMIVTYGPYGNAKRYDNENFVFLVYDPEKITSDSLIAEQHEKATAFARSRYKMSAMRLEEKQKEFSDYEAETINVIRGKSRLNVDLLNSLVAKCKEEIAELSQEVEAQKADMERQLESAAQEQAECEKLESWADLYDNCTFEAKKMIVSQLIKAVYVYRDYRLEVEFRVSFDDFKRLCVGCEPNGGRITTVESA